MAECHLEGFKAMREDLKNPEKRTPAFYNALFNALHKAGLEIDPQANTENPGTSAGVMSDIVRDLPPVIGDEETGHGFH
ncbi:terminase small subunit [Ralstonia phage RPSC1]|uniref:Putative packaging maturation protein A n=1 Tax=Ralstonia phage RPSC1 TaxID=2041351 RepID=A0A2Z2U7T9_9CAUD|nr:terminase small subunit [Ralstonia phage RPSC1]ATN92940.1 putative packaging maturation protein A [Ralstonia phage RPSC1]